MDKTYVFDNNEGGCGNSGMMGLIASLCQNRGLDPNLVTALMSNRGNGFGDGNGSWIWVIFLFFLMGWGRNGWAGFGGNGQGEGNFLAGQLANDTGRDLLMSAIQGNGTAISQLASNLNCDINAVQGSLNQLQSAICNVGNQVGMTSMQVINAIQAGNCQLASQMASCCCDLRQQIADFKGDIALQMCNQTNTLQNSINFVNSSVERGFAAEAYERQAQTNAIVQAIGNQTTLINDKFCQLEMREMQRENQNLRDQVAQYRDSALAQQTATNVVQRINPAPIPAYWVPNVNGCGCNNFGYPFNGYNNGGCCNNNNGCCNQGCGCC
jgi:hypothetical protein